MTLKTLHEIKGLFPRYLHRQHEIILIGNPSKDVIEKYNKAELVDKEELKQSAIEWIKELRKRNITEILPSSYLYAFKPELKEEYTLAVLQFIRFVYNITEADLNSNNNPKPIKRKEPAPLPKNRSNTIDSNHTHWVKQLKAQGVNVLMPIGEQMNRIKGYIKTENPHQNAGCIFQDDDGTFGLFGDMGATNITGIKWEDLGLCDARCWYEWMDTTSK